MWQKSSILVQNLVLFHLFKKVPPLFVWNWAQNKFLLFNNAKLTLCIVHGLVFTVYSTVWQKSSAHVWAVNKPQGLKAGRVWGPNQTTSNIASVLVAEFGSKAVCLWLLHFISFLETTSRDHITSNLLLTDACIFLFLSTLWQLQPRISRVKCTESKHLNKSSPFPPGKMSPGSDGDDEADHAWPDVSRLPRRMMVVAQD